MKVRHSNKVYRDQIVSMLLDGVEARRESRSAAEVDYDSDWHVLSRASRVLFADCSAMAEAYGLVKWYASFLKGLRRSGVSGVPIC
jgi:hypothetical protein